MLSALKFGSRWPRQSGAIKCCSQPHFHTCRGSGCCEFHELSQISSSRSTLLPTPPTNTNQQTQTASLAWRTGAARTCTSPTNNLHSSHGLALGGADFVFRPSKRVGQHTLWILTCYTENICSDDHLGSLGILSTRMSFVIITIVLVIMTTNQY